MSFQKTSNDVKSGQNFAKMTSELHEMLPEKSFLRKMKFEFVKRSVFNSSRLDVSSVEQLLASITTGEFIISRII